MNLHLDLAMLTAFSYPDRLQFSPVFSSIGGRGYFWYLLFRKQIRALSLRVLLTICAENFIVDEVDGTSPVRGQHSNRSMIIGGEGELFAL